MLAYDQLRSQLIRFLDKDLSLDDFEDWFVQATWNMHQDSGFLAQRLAYAIELRLAEHTSGHLSDDQLRQELSVLAHLNLYQSADYQSGASTDFKVTTWVVPSSGKSLVVAFE